MSSVEMISNTERLEKFMVSAEIELFGIINKNGRMIDSWSRNDLHISKERKEILYMQIALQSSMQRDFDEHFGVVSFVTIKRKKLKFVYCPTDAGNTALLITSKNNATDDFSLINDMCMMYKPKTLLRGTDC